MNFKIKIFIDILNRGNPSSSSKGIKNESLNPGTVLLYFKVKYVDTIGYVKMYSICCIILHTGISDIFKSTSPHYKDPTSSSVTALPRFHPESKSSQSSTIVQNMSKAVSVSEITQLV
jgi:hypothetical protein